MNIDFETIWKRKVPFFLTFFLVFTLSYIVLVALDWLPEAPASTAEEKTPVTNEQPNNETTDAGPSASSSVKEAPVKQSMSDSLEEITASGQTNEEAAPPKETELPITLSIKKLDKVVTVLNPTSRTIADLDTALLDGVVRHPDSATLAQEGTVFILGHSSYLPKVFNKNFQAFNGIQNLGWGDTIELSSSDTVYEYRVEKVYRAEAKDVTVPIAGHGRTLTLATCNSFGSVDDRYIVEAKQVGVRQL